MKHLLIFMACWLGSVLAMAQPTAMSYYVDGTTGNNANSGTSAAPWRTIQKACDAATPNSTVLVRGGTYTEKLVVRVSGTAGNPIVFKAAGPELVVVDGGGTKGTLLQISNRSHLRFENMTFQNLLGNGSQGILVETTGSSTATNLTFRNLTVRRIRWTASATTTPGSNDNAQGMVVYGRQGGITNITIENCELTDNILGFSEALSLDGNVDGFVVQDCRVHDNTNIGILLAGNYKESPVPATDHARNGVVRRNLCYRNVSGYATSGGIYADGAHNVVIEGNQCYENGYGIEIGAEENGTTENITVKNNLIYRNVVAGMALGGYTASTTGQVLGAVVRNNTFLFNDSANDGSGELTITKASNARIENNVFYTNAQNTLLTAENISPQTGNVLNYNSWYGAANNPNDITIEWRGKSYSSFQAYQTGTGQEANSRYTNPKLVAPTLPIPDARLQASSWCINAANPTTTVAPGETDLAGLPRVAGSRLDIGAYEFSSTPLAATASASEAAIRLFPVPSRTTLWLDMPFRASAVVLYSSKGQLLQRLPAGTTSISVGQLPAGLYLLQLTTPTGQHLARRFVKE